MILVYKFKAFFFSIPAIYYESFDMNMRTSVIGSATDQIRKSVESSLQSWF